jgi:Xaa-Pro aminopeptidase
MAYAIDQQKWQRVRQMMERHDLDAVVVRAPDNVLYLTNYWTMKGYVLGKEIPRCWSSSRNSTRRSARHGTKTCAIFLFIIPWTRDRP